MRILSIIITFAQHAEKTEFLALFVLKQVKIGSLLYTFCKCDDLPVRWWWPKKQSTEAAEDAAVQMEGGGHI